MHQYFLRTVTSSEAVKIAWIKNINASCQNQERYKPLGTTRRYAYRPNLRPGSNSPLGLLHIPVICLIYTLKKREIHVEAHHSAQYRCENLKISGELNEHFYM